MRALNLLHIGDVHFPGAPVRRHVDYKDKAFPSHVADATTSSPLQSVIRHIHAHALEKTDTVLISGDLTTAGNLPAYKQCLDYLNLNLRLTDRDPETVHAVPGNHDVDRAKCSPGHLFEKFQPYAAAWRDLGIPILTVDRLRLTQLQGHSCAASILSVNSSVGCGETRHLPAPVQGKLRRLLDAYVRKVGLADAFAVVGETLDTPAFLDRDMDDIAAELSNLGPKSVPILLSHHNLLPQALPQIAMYSDVINGGAMRSRLSRQSRVVLYCHGHTP